MAPPIWEKFPSISQSRKLLRIDGVKLSLPDKWVCGLFNQNNARRSIYKSKLRRGGGFRQRPTLPHSDPCSTIGAEGLYFRVRDGNGCCPFAITAENLEKYQLGAVTLNNDMIRQASVKPKVKPHDQLVLLDFTRYRASICSLSTSSSSTGLWGQFPGALILRLASHLDAFSGYPIRT